MVSLDDFLLHVLSIVPSFTYNDLVIYKYSLFVIVRFTFCTGYFFFLKPFERSYANV